MRQSGTNGWHVLTDKECGITVQDKINAKKEVVEYLEAKKNQHKDVDKMLDEFLAKLKDEIATKKTNPAASK